MFINDRKSKATNYDGTPKQGGDWELSPILVESDASVGTGAIVFAKVIIGEGVLIGAGAEAPKSLTGLFTVTGYLHGLILEILNYDPC